MVSHQLTIRVRYCECDPMGVAHHSVYPVWFEMGRTELLRDSHQPPLTYRDLEHQGVFLAVTSIQIRYRRPARYDDLLTLHTKLVDVGHVKIEHEYQLLRDSVTLATGASTLACLDRNGKPQMLPAMLRRD